MASLWQQVLLPKNQNVKILSWMKSRVTLHTTEPTCTQPSIVQHTTGHWCPVVCPHFREHARHGQRSKRLFWKQIFGLQSISDLKTQFVVCDYLHNVSHTIWLIMNRNRKACLAYIDVNDVCLRVVGCVYRARLLCFCPVVCIFARLCAMSSAPCSCDRREDSVSGCIPQ